MELTIDKAGRVVIPKSVRDGLGFQAGDILELDRQGDVLRLRPKAPVSKSGGRGPRAGKAFRAKNAKIAKESQTQS
ncbi:MAG TPA: AbrB/MazE/SpoVT family DNA-binding domain-containing protein [Candidatus Acidoferrum sp.]|nr:AbrB/MazE/SpoVT family DNA-binding domain-containing protein [Candidatus Acidoferrum sp.]